jgi:porphobilinogen synthase
MYPIVRMRRFRRNRRMRELVAETQLMANQLIYPIFIKNQGGEAEAIPSMPGQFRQTMDTLEPMVEQAISLGVHQFILFGLPDEKDAEASSASDDHGVIQTALRRLRSAFGDQVLLIADTCMCEYTPHGHCGVVLDGNIVNDPSLEILSRIAVSQAEAGADMVAPSDMMDGRVLWIREALDEAGFEDLPIMSYAAKYASAFYGPFREAVDSEPAFGDRKTYQMDYRNVRQALDEVTLDITEGSDLILIKPGMAYLDVLSRVREHVSCPLVVYNVSGEYSMIKAAASEGWIDEQQAVLEVLYGFRRAGADSIITYHALDAARWLKFPMV